MSNSFKKVIACLLAVLMVMFSVPFAAFAAGSDYTPDIQLQFGILNENAADAESWVTNFSEGPAHQKGKNTSADFSMSALSAPQLVATGKVSADAKYSVTGLTLEAADVDTYLAARATDTEFETDKQPLTPEEPEAGANYDYALKAGDGFTVTVRMDNVDTVYNAVAEIAYSNNIEPLYVVENGKMSSTSRTVDVGTAAQVGEDESVAAPMAEYDAAALYADINADEIGSTIKADYDGQKYMYCEIIGDGTTDWSPVTNEEAPILTNEDGSIGNTYAGKSVMATFMFVLKSTPSADNPIEFWVHNGNTDAHAKDDESGDDMFSSFNEGVYEATADDNLATAATYSNNRFAGGDGNEPWAADPANAGSYKVTFMGKNENVQSAAHEHDFTGAQPSWTWANDNSSATATITCTADGCDESEGYQISATDSDIESTVKTAGTCTTAAVNTLTASVTLNGATVSTTKDVEGAIDANNHNYVPAYTEPTCTANGFTTYTCSRCGASYVEYDDPATTLAHSYTVPVSIAWDSEDAVTATVTLKCATCDATTTTDATVNSVEKSAATCTADQVMTYTASYDGLDSISKDVTVANTATDHAWVASSVDWNSLDTTTAKVDVNYVCTNDSTHTKKVNVTATTAIKQAQTEDDAEITTFTVSVDGLTDSKDVQTKAAAGHTTHTYTVPVSIAWDSEDAVTATVTLKCTKCDATTTTAATVNSVEKSAATCTANQVMTYTASYAGLDSISKDVEVANTATDHNWTATEITWDGADAVTATANFVCANDAKHTKTEAATVDKTLKTAATVSAPAVYTYTASYDGFASISKDVEEGEALGVNITVPKFDIGKVCFNGEELNGTKVNTTNVAYGSTYTLEASVENDNQEFKGWEMNGKIVSEDEKFSTYAYTDVTVTPVFVAKNTNLITVVFYDKYGNNVKEYKDMSIEDYQAAILADGIPTAQSYPSQKFVSWDTDDATILGLTESKTIWAIYTENDATPEYSVTVNDATGTAITDTALTLPAGISADAVPYDTKATVYNENAKGWAIDGVTVSTTNTFTFYVGADTIVTMIVDDVEEEATTTIIGANRLADPAYRYNIVATRNVPAGYTLVDYGFVYGKNIPDAELVLENEGENGSEANSGQIKVARAGTQNSASNQFALNYGIKTAGNYVCVRSFITVKKGNEVKVVYSNAERFDS